MKSYFPVAIALLAGAALGYCLAPSSSAPAAVEEAKTEDAVSEATVQDEGDQSSLKALRARVRELEGLLKEKGVEVEQLKEEENEREARRERRFDPRAEMERIKKEEPERYAQMTNHMAQFRRRRLERAQHKMDILGSVDTSRMSAEARQTHEALQDAIEAREMLEDKMKNFMEMSDEERQSVMEEMHEATHKLMELNEAERDNLLTQTAVDLGFEDDDAAEIVETVKQIYEATDAGNWFGPGGRRGRRGGR